MAIPRVLVLRAPGANCDVETQFAFEQAGAAAERVHINRLREQPGLLQRYQILAVPGGFTYGDDVAAGKILAPATTMEEMQRIIFNDYVDGTLAALFVLVVVAIAVYGAIYIRRALSSPSVTSVEVGGIAAPVGVAHV